MALRYQVVYYHRQLESGKVDVMAGNESLADENGGQARRKAVMAVLAHSATADIEGRLATIALPDHEDLREPESGLVMVRGRVGGDGAPLISARRRYRGRGAAVDRRSRFRLDVGRYREKARLIALCDPWCSRPACWRDRNPGRRAVARGDDRKARSQGRGGGGNTGRFRDAGTG